MSNSTKDPSTNETGTDPTASDDSNGDDDDDTSGHGRTYTQMVQSDPPTREELARLFFDEGLDRTQIAERVNATGTAAISQLMKAYGVNPGRTDYGKQWVLARLPYKWASPLRAKHDTASVPPSKMYDAEVAPADLPPAGKVGQPGHFPPDVPDTYSVVTRINAVNAAHNRGHDPTDLYRFAHAYQLPDTIPGGGIEVYNKHALRRDTVSERIAGFMLAVSGNPDERWPAREVAHFFPEVQPDTVGKNLQRLHVAGLLDAEDDGIAYQYRVADYAIDPLRGEQDWSEVEHLAPDASADADGDGDGNGETEEMGEVLTTDDLTPETLAIEYYRNWMSYGDIAEAYEVSERTVRRKMSDAGINPGTGGERLEQVKEAIADLDVDINDDKIAQRLQRLRDLREYHAKHSGGDDTSTDTTTTANTGTDADAADSQSMSAPNADSDDQQTDSTDSTTDFKILPDSASKEDVEMGTPYWAKVNNIKDYGVFVSLNNVNKRRADVTGLIHRTRMLFYDPDEFVPNEDEVVVELVNRKSNGDLQVKLVERLTNADTEREADYRAYWGDPDDQQDDDADADTGRTIGAMQSREDRDDLLSKAQNASNGGVQAASDDATDTTNAETGAAAEPTDAPPAAPVDDDDDGDGDGERVPADSEPDDADEETEEAEALQQDTLDANGTPMPVDSDTDPRDVVLDTAYGDIGYEAMAKLYYYYGLDQTAIASLYNGSPGTVSGAMAQMGLSPGHARKNAAAVMTRLRTDDGFEWAADLTGRGQGRPDDVAAAATDTRLHTVLSEDDTVPTPVETASDVAAEDTPGDQQATSDGAQDAEAAQADAGTSAPADTAAASGDAGDASETVEVPDPDENLDRRPYVIPIGAYDDVVAQVEEDRELAPSDGPMAYVARGQRRALDRVRDVATRDEDAGEVVLDANAFEREDDHAREDETLAPEESEMYYLARGKRRVFDRFRAAVTTRRD